MNHGIWVTPSNQSLENAVKKAGGKLTSCADASAIICTHDDLADLSRSLHPNIRWVQLGAAGIETWFDAGVMKPEILWTAAKGVYAKPIAEHILAMMLAACRELPTRLRAKSWGESGGRMFAGSTVGVIGAGGIGMELFSLLKPFDVHTLSINRRGSFVGADISLAPENLNELLVASDFVVLAAPLTSETRGMISTEQFRQMRSSSWLINIARGQIVNTEDLLQALIDKDIAGASLDVTEPEPLPIGHPFWDMENVIITPHVSGTFNMGLPFLAIRVEENVRRFIAHKPLLGLVDLEASY